MPVLQNPRWERFARERAKGEKIVRAYAKAGYSAQRSNAARLIANDSVKARIAELQEKPAKKLEVTLESLLAEAEEARQLAMKLGQSAAAIAAVKEKGVLSGKRIERKESGEPGEFDRLDATSLREAIAERLAMAGQGDASSELAGKPGVMRGESRRVH